MKSIKLIPLLSIFLVVMLTPRQLVSDQTSNVRTFEFTYTVHVPKLPTAGKTLRLWIPVPKSDSHQTISKLKVDSPVSFSMFKDPEYANSYVYAMFTTTEPLDLEIRFDVERREHRVSLGQEPVKNAKATQEPKQQLARFLSADHLVPVDGLIATLAAEATEGRSTSIEKARAIYDYVISHMHYDKSGEGWGQGNAIFACTTRRGNCTDFHSLFIGMMRAVGIPARFEIGFSVPSDRTGGIIRGYHCWAEFYLESYGWIPVDASEGWKNPTRREYFFGAHDDNRVQFTVGRDLILRPEQKGDRLNYFIYPYGELDGKPFTLKAEFSFRDINREL